jgi:hypothetical protein
MSVALKDPGAVLDYSEDWTSYLAAGETISTSSWVVKGGDAALVIGATILNGNVCTAFVSAGTKGQVYELVNTITTNQGRTDARSWTVRVDVR